MSVVWPELVVDASVGVKWDVPEEHSEKARLLLHPETHLHVPTIFFSEVTQAIWKKSYQRGQMDPAEAREVLSKLLNAPVEPHPVNALLDSALKLAMDTGRTVYDCVYLVLAQALDCPLVTADLKFHNALRSTPFASSLIWVGDLEDAPPALL